MLIFILGWNIIIILVALIIVFWNPHLTKRRKPQKCNSENCSYKQCLDSMTKNNQEMADYKYAMLLSKLNRLQQENQKLKQDLENAHNRNRYLWDEQRQRFLTVSEYKESVKKYKK